MIRIGALISGTGSNLEAVRQACEAGEIDGKIVFAGADKPSAKGLAIAEKAGVPTFVVDYASIIKTFKTSFEKFSLPADFDINQVVAQSRLFEGGVPTDEEIDFFRTRAAAEAGLLSHMAAYSFDLLILAGFMRKLTPYFIDRVNIDPAAPRIMNIHPALLPSFPGTDGYGDTWRYGCKVGGCTVHFVDYGEDTGPIIGQKAFPITPSDTLETVKEKGLQLEWQLYPECIRLFAEGRLKVTTRPYGGAAGETRERRVVNIS